MVAFTGGVEIGKRVASLLGYRRAILELGGNDPLIILADADLDAAVRLAVQGCYANSGQRCTTVKRLIVAEPVADVFARRFTEASAAIRVGDPHHDATDMGTVISEEAARQLEAPANDAIAAGATRFTATAGGARSAAARSTWARRLATAPRRRRSAARKTAASA